MHTRGKEVYYTYHVLNKLFRADHLDIINNVLKTGKWKSFSKDMYKVHGSGIVIVIKELPDRFKVITIGGKYEENYKM